MLQVESQGKTFKVTFVSAEEEITVECKDDEYILDAAEAAGLDLPCTCRGGICGACVTRVTDGTVDQSDIDDLRCHTVIQPVAHMRLDNLRKQRSGSHYHGCSFTLTDEEIESGCALICMARATSDVRMEIQADWGYSLGITDWKANGKFVGEVDPLMGKKWKEIAKKE